MTTDTFLVNAGWLFFAVWIAVITSVTIAAFGRELLPWKPTPLRPTNLSRRKPHPLHPAPDSESEVLPRQIQWHARYRAIIRWL
jgi:hypothetical protein